MTTKGGATDRVARLVRRLASKDPATRKEARNKLVNSGGPDITRALVLALSDLHPHVRWEAAKALTAIADPVAAPALMNVLDDDNGDVRWVAAEALIALGMDGLPTVLNGLAKRAKSVNFCRAAHHVLHELRDLTTAVAPVLSALDNSEPAVSAPPAAYEALVALSNSRRQT